MSPQKKKQVVCGIPTKEGWWVKSTEDGQPFPPSALKVPFGKAGVKTLCDAFEFGVKKFKNDPCMHTRELLNRQIIDEQGRKVEKCHYGNYVSNSFNEIHQYSQSAGLGIRSLGIKPGSRIAIFAETRKEWFVSAMGCLQQRITVCTLYATLNNESLVHGINETQVELLFTSYDLLSKVVKILPQCPKVRTIVIMEDQLEGIGKSISPEGRVFISYKELINIGELSNHLEKEKVTPDDIAIIMYTSGSTGTPKGVELTHSCILASMEAYSALINVSYGDRYLAYLPLAHIMELATEFSLMSIGVSIFFSSPHTLTSSSPKIVPGTFGDAKLAKPTALNAVPLVLERIIKGVMQTVEKQGRLKNFIFSGILDRKAAIDNLPTLSKIVDYLVFHRVREELGGNLKRVVVGGAPLSPQIHKRMREIFGCTIQVGYGSTETASCSTGMVEQDFTTGKSGGPNMGVSIKLIDWQEGGYLLSDTPYPRGEVLVGGEVVAKGYFRRPAETKETFLVECGKRWFRSGDIGEIDATGSLRIIDRKKDLIKLKHGEYVSLGNIESKLKVHPLVDNMCVFADSTTDKTVVVVVPIIDKLIQMTKHLGIEDTQHADELCSSAAIKSSLLKDFQDLGKNCGLNKWEIPAAVHLAAEFWTPDTGLVTAALKLRRKQLENYYNLAIKEMYANFM